MTKIKAVIFDWGRTIYDSEKKVEFQESKGILELCRKKGYKLAVASLVTHHALVTLSERTKQVEESPLRGFFDVVRITDKDKDQILDEIVAELGFRREEILIVDDRVVRGIKYGNKRGHPTVWLQRGKFENELPDADTGMPTFRVRSLDEIQIILENETTL